MTLTLPSPIDAYVAASNRSDSEALVALFSDDAVVHDEGREYRGVDGVREWRAKSENAYTFTIEPLSLVERDGETVLTASVAGSFPGSPVDLDFEFTIAGDRIAALAIHP